MDFVKDWPLYALEGEAKHYLKRHKVLEGVSEQARYTIDLSCHAAGIAFYAELCVNVAFL